MASNQIAVDLRTLARRVEQLAIESPVFSMVTAEVQVFSEHLQARARIIELQEGM